MQRVEAKNASGSLQAAAYAYDTAGRLQSVADGPSSATYAHHANSLPINTVVSTNTAASGMTTTRAYDKLNRLLSISSVFPVRLRPSFPSLVLHRQPRRRQV